MEIKTKVAWTFDSSMGVAIEQIKDFCKGESPENAEVCFEALREHFPLFDTQEEMEREICWDNCNLVGNPPHDHAPGEHILPTGYRPVMVTLDCIRSLLEEGE